MPSQQQHVAQARRNRAFADSLDREAFPEWVTVAWFYCALHLVDVLFADMLPGRMGHPSNHEARWRAMSMSEDWKRRPALQKHYRALEDVSQLARYECQPQAAVFTQAGLECVYHDHLLPLVDTLEKLLP